MISAIIPVSDPRYLENQMELLKYQEIKQLIILDSSLQIKNNIPNDKRITIIEENSFDHGATRNKGAKLSSYPILLFMTQDAKPFGEEFAREIIKSIDEKIKGVYGKHLTTNQAKLLERIERKFVYPDKKIIKFQGYNFNDIFVSNVCFAVESRTFEELGGFPEGVICSEELVLSKKILSNGFSIMYNPKITVIHQHDEKTSEIFKRWFDVGVAFSKNPTISSKFRSHALKLALFVFLEILKEKPKLIPELPKRYVTRGLAIEIGKRHKLLKAAGIDLKKISNNKNFWLKFDR